MTIVDRMEALATEWHHGVERKGKGHIPYITHPRAVVNLLREWGVNEENGTIPLAVAWGHDLVEDTRVPACAILNAGGKYGREIMDGILWLTFDQANYPEAPDNDTAGLEYMSRIGTDAPPEIMMVKLADRICNTRDFRDHPPKDEPTKAARYLHEADPLLAHLDRVPKVFSAAVMRTLEELKNEIGYATWTRKGTI